MIKKRFSPMFLIINICILTFILLLIINVKGVSASTETRLRVEAKNMEELKTYITQNLPVDIYLTGHTYDFSEELNNNNNRKIRIYGNEYEKPRFIMNESIPTNSRFVSMAKGTLELENITLIGAGLKASGGIAAEKVKVTNCDFSNNNYFYGGAIGRTIKDGTDIQPTRIEAINSKFKDNMTSYDGGAIAIDTSADNSELIISNCEFDNNVRYGAGLQLGGAVSAKRVDKVRITESKFTDNMNIEGRDNIGGAISVLAVPDVLISDSYFEGNLADNTGGAIAVTDCGDRNPNYGKNPMTYVTNCTFKENSAEYGGAIWVNNQGGQWMHVTGNTFSGNMTPKKEYGEAIYYHWGPYTRLFVNSNSLNKDSVAKGPEAGSLEGTPYIENY